MGRIGLLAESARRTKAVNSAFGTALRPDEVAARYSDEDCDLLIAWWRHISKAS